MKTSCEHCFIKSSASDHSEQAALGKGRYRKVRGWDVKVRDAVVVLRGNRGPDEWPGGGSKPREEILWAVHCQ